MNGSKYLILWFDHNIIIQSFELFIKVYLSFDSFSRELTKISCLSKISEKVRNSRNVQYDLISMLIKLVMTPNKIVIIIL